MSTQHVQHLFHAGIHHAPVETASGVGTGVISSVVAPGAVTAVGSAITSAAGAISGVVGTTGLLGSTIATIAAINPLTLGAIVVGGAAFFAVAAIRGKVK